MAMDLQSPVASMAQPSPASSTMSRGPSTARSRSRPSIRRRESSPGPSSSTPGLPTPALSPDGQSDSEEITEEDTLAPFDPRRITPTLHASLVSEILSLRRDVESKTKTIDVLEQSLDESTTANERLGSNLSQATREVRSLKHQIQLLEGGTSSSMTELARERDEAVENLADVRKKLEQAQKRVRSREDDTERMQALWDRERESWTSERRNWERKVHVVEGRLKTVLNEVAAAQENGTLTKEMSKDRTKESDTASVISSSPGHRRTSLTSMTSDEGDGSIVHNVRYSVMSIAAGAKGDSGQNLAEELAFDEEDEFADSDPDSDGLDSPEALAEERPVSSQSHASHNAVASKARKLLGLAIQSPDSNHATDYRAYESSGQTKAARPAVEYCDSGIQYSPPSSPKLSPVIESPVGEIATVSVKTQTAVPHEDDGSDDQAPQMVDNATLTIATEMVSVSCQTVGDLPSPPWTPKLIEPPSQPAEAVSESAPMVSCSTQTDPTPAVEVDNLEEKRSTLSPNDIPSSNTEVPMIAIHPPGSEPASPRNSVVLPPQTKSISCQTNFRSIVEGRSVGIQTEEIRVDQRPVKLPASLLPSAIPDVPPRSELRESGIQLYRAPPPPPVKGPPTERLAKPSRAPSSEHVQAYPGNNDNGPLSNDVVSGLRRPFRSSSLFAGFSDDEVDPEDRDVFTDDDLLNRPFASYTLRRGKLASKSRHSLEETTLPEIDEQLSDPESRPSDTGLHSSRSAQRPGIAAPNSRQSGMRKMAMISNGAAIHQKSRTRSPSLPSLDSGSAGSSIAPPFPVPTRLSSRKIPLNGSDGPPSPTRSAGRQFSERGHPSLVRRPTLRRVRSAAAMSQTDPTEVPETISTSTRSMSPFTPDTPTFQPPPLPSDDITMARDRRVAPKRASHHPTASRNWSQSHERQDSTGGVQPTSVVDAIAQTMVGEWMFKYVRRRKSFGMGEAKDSWEGRNPDEVSANITNSGVRHKRWVWLAPYEGSIMWSSKQPTSGPALLGKSGRKFTIQSVLDVKDDNLLPKGSNPPTAFNRSILVLTPQRALKFTALTMERHYVWLTALSFLSHSAMGLHDLAALPPLPQEEAGLPVPPQAALRRNPIRDSIRVAKGRPRPMPKGKRSFGSATVPAPDMPSNGLDTINSMIMAADAPHVPRFSTHNNHTRKRSNTAPRPPAMHAIRSFSSKDTMPSYHSGTTANSSEAYFPPMQPPSLPPGLGSCRSSFSRTSEASGRASSTHTGATFDVGTIRMEAFIDRHAEQINKPRPVPQNRTRHVRKSSSQWSEQRRYEFDLPAFDESELGFRAEDPFRGF